MSSKDQTVNAGDNEGPDRLQPSRWRRRAVIGAMAALLGGAVATLSRGSTGAGWCGWKGHGRWGHSCGWHDARDLRDRVGQRLEWLLGEIDADAGQREEIRALVFEAVTDLSGLGARHRANHAALLEVLGQERVDREALEHVRSKAIELAEDASRRVTAALADLAGILTPAQRARLAKMPGSAGR